MYGTKILLDRLEYLSRDSNVNDLLHQSNRVDSNRFVVLPLPGLRQCEESSIAEGGISRALVISSVKVAKTVNICSEKDTHVCIEKGQ
jgi:hypothetical protein